MWSPVHPQVVANRDEALRAWRMRRVRRGQCGDSPGGSACRGPGVQTGLPGEPSGTRQGPWGGVAVLTRRGVVLIPDCCGSCAEGGHCGCACQGVKGYLGHGLVLQNRGLFTQGGADTLFREQGTPVDPCGATVRRCCYYFTLKSQSRGAPLSGQPRACCLWPRPRLRCCQSLGLSAGWACSSLLSLDRGLEP